MCIEKVCLIMHFSYNKLPQPHQELAHIFCRFCICNQVAKHYQKITVSHTLTSVSKQSFLCFPTSAPFFYIMSISDFSNHLNPIHTKFLSFWKDFISSTQLTDTITWEIAQNLDIKPKCFESECILSLLLPIKIE